MIDFHAPDEWAMLLHGLPRYGYRHHPGWPPSFVRIGMVEVMPR